MIRVLDRWLSRILNAPSYEKSREVIGSLAEAHSDVLSVCVGNVVSDAGPAGDIPMRIYLRTSKYTEIRPGIWARLVRGTKDVIFEWESIFNGLLGSLNFTKNMVLFVKFSAAPSPIAWQVQHYHQGEQTVYCVEGEYIGEANGTVFSGGDKQHIPPGRVHVFIPTKDGYAVVETDWKGVLRDSIGVS